MKLAFLFSLLLAVQLCSSTHTYNPNNFQSWNNQPWNNQPWNNQPWNNQPWNNQPWNWWNSGQWHNNRCPDDHYQFEQYNYPNTRDYSKYNYFNSCKDILTKFPDTPSGYYYITTGPDSYRKVYCEMERKICGEKGWEKFYYLNLVENQTQNCPTSFVKKTHPTPPLVRQPFCEKANPVGNNKCTKAYFPLQERQYYEVCAKVRGYQHGTPTAFKPFDIEDSKFHMDGIHFTYGKEEWHLWSYVIGAHRNYDKGKMDLRELCPDVSPKYNWTIPFYLGHNYYCDSGLYKYSGESDATRFHYENRLWEGKDCKKQSFSCKRSGQPWFYTKLPTYMEDHIEIHSCFNDQNADVRFDNLEIYLR